MEILIPLKLKYRSNRNFTGGSYRTRTGNTYGPTPKRAKGGQGMGVRRRAYNTHKRA